MPTTTRRFLGLVGTGRVAAALAPSIVSALMKGGASTNKVVQAASGTGAPVDGSDASEKK